MANRDDVATTVKRVLRGFTSNDEAVENEKSSLTGDLGLWDARFSNLTKALNIKLDEKFPGYKRMEVEKVKESKTVGKLIDLALSCASGGEQ